MTWGRRRLAPNVLLVVVALSAGCGGTIELGRLPDVAAGARLEIAGIDDGALAGGGGRAVSLGQSVPVVVAVANPGDVVASDVRVEIVLRHGPGLEPVGPLARIEPAPGNPTAVAPGLPPARFSYNVVVSPEAVPEIWVVGARVQANQGQLTAAAPEGLQRRWTLQRPPRLVVTGIAPEVGDVSFGHLSLNPGCPAVVVAQVRNDGEAAVSGLQAKLVLGPSEPPLLIAPAGLPPARLEGGATARAAFRLETPMGIASGTDLAARVLVTGIDENSRAPVASAPAEGPSLAIVTSGARLLATRITAPREPLAPGTIEVPFGVELIYLPGVGGSPRLEEVRAGLRFERDPELWRLRPQPTNPVLLEGCTTDPPQACPTTGFGLSVDVPPEILAGPVPVAAGAMAIERLRDGRSVAVCGGSNPLFAESTAVIEIR